MDEELPPSPEHEEALSIAKSQPIPPHVINQATELGHAAAENRLTLTTFVPHGSKIAYYMLGTIIDGHTLPLAIIPAGMSPAEWMVLIDKLIRKHGTKELDPKFDGIVH